MDWFRPSLEGIATLIQKQLDACEDIHVRVQVRVYCLKEAASQFPCLSLSKQKIILFGGYSQSKTLQHFLKQKFSHPKIVCPKAGYDLSSSFHFSS